MHPLERYLRELRDLRSSGAAVPETSYYTPLANLLNEVGRGLRPRVQCVINIRNQGAGLPDGGLFTPDQLQADPDTQLARGQTPARGVLEVKGTGDDLLAIARGEQVRRYWERYRQVLVTNLRDFVLVGADADGDFAPLERYVLAPGEAAFWAAAAAPHLLADEHGAPFVVAHLQLGLLLQNAGAPLSDTRDERVGVYLTNALTGWEPPAGPKQHLLFPELEQERDAAERVKREAPILVILGNPPYNAFTGVSPQEERGLVEPYKAGLIAEWGIRKFNLDDLYVRFFRLAERRIAEGRPGRGIVCYISNFSYLSDPSFVVMRRRFLAEFDEMWFDSLNGDSRETGKLTPEGKPDPSVFSTQYNREGIRVGTTIGLLVRKAERDAQPTVRYRQFWGVTKRADLLDSLNAEDFDAQYEPANPVQANRFSFRPSDVTTHYLEWPKLVGRCADAAQLSRRVPRR